MDRLGPMESQVAGLLQLPPHGQDLGLDRGIGSLGGSGDPRAVVPIDAIQPSPPRMLDPVVDGGGAHAELTCDRASPLPLFARV